MLNSPHSSLGSVAKCPHCGSGDFRSSHLRMADVLRLAILQRPLRCSICLERFYLRRKVANQAWRAHERTESPAQAAAAVRVPGMAINPDSADFYRSEGSERDNRGGSAAIHS